jgi:pyruvate/2-oxoacid:ferredoxin oxidoreductase beta subunit
MRRNLEDAIIVSYQGDGDLAGIGTAEIIHAANRGENITVLFINNAIYGMTGGQMAPTTLVGQKTTTTPGGRTIQQDGGPIGMAELMNALPTPVYIERVSLSSPKNIVAAEKAIKKGIVNQIDKKGFSFVEILSPCPVNWKMEPFEALAWIKTHLEPVFPVKVFRDNSAPLCGDSPVAQRRRPHRAFPA